MATRLKDAVKLGDLPRKGGVLELDVALGQHDGPVVLSSLLDARFDDFQGLRS